jgi:hypothetical protein
MAASTTMPKGKYTESLTFSTPNCIYANYGKLGKPSLHHMDYYPFSECTFEGLWREIKSNTEQKKGIWQRNEWHRDFVCFICFLWFHSVNNHVGHNIIVEIEYIVAFSCGFWICVAYCLRQPFNYFMLVTLIGLWLCSTEKMHIITRLKEHRR